MEPPADNIEIPPVEQRVDEVKRGPKRKKFVPPPETDDETQRIVVKEYKTKSSRVLKGGVVKDYESTAHKVVPYIETREYKTLCRNLYNECVSLIAPSIRNRKKLEELKRYLESDWAV